MPLVVEERDGKVVLANDAIRFTFNLRQGRYMIRRDASGTAPAIVNATAQAAFKSGARSTVARMDQEGSIVWQGAPGHDAHGTGHHSLFYWTGPDTRLGLTVVIYETLPYLLLRLTFTHRLPGGVMVESLAPLIAEPRQEGGLRWEQAPGGLTYFHNGWSSWSPALSVGSGQAPLDSQFVRHGRTACLNAATPAGSKTELWSESFTVIGPRPDAPGDHTGLVAGFASLGDQFSAIGAGLPPAGRGAAPQGMFQMVCQCDQILLQPDTSLGSEWAFFQWADLLQSDVLAEYALAAARQMDARIPVRGPVGWSSRQQGYEVVNERTIIGALDAVTRHRDRFPIELVEVDAGYADIAGDWMQINTTKFPHGMPWLAEQIRAQGCIPGLWLAPFIVHPESLVAVDHGDWLLREGGRPVLAGVLGDVGVYALDTTHPAVLDWLAETIRRVRREWGFPYLELDYLYAAALPGKRHDPGLTRAQALRRALLYVREVAGPDTFLLASGCPLGPAVGLVNAMRVGPDSAAAWYTRDSRWTPLFKPGPAMPGARNAIRNTLTRSVLHRRWWLNDAGCLALGTQDLSPGAPRDAAGLGDSEACSLASVVGLSGGQLLIGDDLAEVDSWRLALAESLLPTIPESALAYDLLQSEMPERYVLYLDRPCGQWAVAAVFNWSDASRDLVVRRDELGLPGGGPLHVYDFWQRQYHRLMGDEFLLPGVPPRGGHVLGFRAMAPGAHLVATTFHISQGGEITLWDASPGRLSFTLTLERQAEGDVLVWAPAPPRSAACDGRPAILTDVGGGVWAVGLTVAKTSAVEIALE